MWSLTNEDFLLARPISEQSSLVDPQHGDSQSLSSLVHYRKRKPTAALQEPCLVEASQPSSWVKPTQLSRSLGEGGVARSFHMEGTDTSHLVSFIPASQTVEKVEWHRGAEVNPRNPALS